MTNFKNLIEQAEEENASMSDFVEYPEGRYLINFVQADEITDFVSKSGKTYDAGSYTHLTLPTKVTV